MVARNHEEILQSRWAIWQLNPDDVKTYGEKAGEFIITTEDGDDEVTGVAFSQEIAQHIVYLHNQSLAV